MSTFILSLLSSSHFFNHLCPSPLVSVIHWLFLPSLSSFLSSYWPWLPPTGLSGSLQSLSNWDLNNKTQSHHTPKKHEQDLETKALTPCEPRRRNDLSQQHQPANLRPVARSSFLQRSHHKIDKEFRGVTEENYLQKRIKEVRRARCLCVSEELRQYMPIVV